LQGYDGESLHGEEVGSMIRRRHLVALAAAFVVAPRAVGQTPAHGSSFTWKTAGLASEAFDAEALRKLPELLRTEFPNTLALTVVRDDRVVLDYRRPGVAQDELFRTYSITKSVLALLIGIALDRGMLPSLDRSVASYFPEIDLAGADPRAREVTIRHILTMTAGWDTSSLPGVQAPQVTTSGFLRPMADVPGTVFSYDNNATNILGILLSRAVGARLDAFADDVLFRPAGIDRHVWRQTPDGYPAASGGLSLSMDSILRLGRLVLRRGDWDGKRIVSEAFLAEALSHRTLVNAQEKLSYGYLWFSQLTPDARHEGYTAQGFGGQVLHVVPGLNLIIATTTQPGNGGTTRFIRSAILPAARG
jgi:CubicO group peptidase (beta-lactamase class C family)